MHCVRPCCCRASTRSASIWTSSIASAPNCRSTGAMSNVSDEVQELAESSPDLSPHRQDEPYRRAITGIYARLAATAARLGHGDVARHAVGEAPAYDSARGIRRRSLDPAPLPALERIGLPYARPPAQAASRGRCVRLSSGEPRHAPEFRRPSARDCRALREGHPRHGLRGAAGGQARRPAPGRAPDAAPPDIALSRILPRNLIRACHRPRGGRGAPPVRHAPPCRTTSSRRRATRPTFSRSPCFSRRLACCVRAKARWM